MQIDAVQGKRQAFIDAIEHNGRARDAAAREMV
jgi:hypothetical protein